MKKTINFYEFERAFHDYDRFDNFGYAGLKALFEYLEELEEDCGTEIELDVIALCCDYSQYDSATEAADERLTDWRDDLAGEATEEEIEAEALEQLQDNTTVIEYDGGIIVQSF